MVQVSRCFWNNYTYLHAIDDIKSRKKPLIIIAKTWVASYYLNTVFKFLFGMMEVDILLELTNIYVPEPMEALEFWNNLAKAVLNNTYYLA